MVMKEGFVFIIININTIKEPRNLYKLNFTLFVCNPGITKDIQIQAT